MHALEQDTFETWWDSIISAYHPAVEGCRNKAKSGEISRRYPTQLLLTSAPLVVADLLALVSSVFLAFVFVGLLGFDFRPDLASVLPLLSGALLLIYAISGLYPGTGMNPIVELRQISIVTTLLFAALFAASLVHGGDGAFLSFLVAAFLFSIVFVPILRFIARSLASHFRWWGQPVLIFGGNALGIANYKHLRSHPHLGLRPVGIVDDLLWDGSDGMAEPSAYLGPFDRATGIARQHGVFWAVVAMPERSFAEVRQIIKTHAGNFPHVLVAANTDGLPSLWNRTCDWSGLPSICMDIDLLLPLPRLLKRIIDLAIVMIGGICCLPLIALIAVLIKLSSAGPIIYGQERIGLNGRRFYAWKFRTMVVNADKVLEQYLAADPQLQQEWKNNHKLKNDPRVTKVGRWLRKLSLDELPQLWNVLLGEMSLVGPRPIVHAEASKYGENIELYTKVLPGLTGLWQISGRNNTTYAERVRLDTYYVRNWSPWMDLYILARTVKVAVRGEGAY